MYLWERGLKERLLLGGCPFTEADPEIYKGVFIVNLMIVMVQPCHTTFQSVCVQFE